MPWRESVWEVAPRVASKREAGVFAWKAPWAERTEEPKDDSRLAPARVAAPREGPSGGGAALPRRAAAGGPLPFPRARFRWTRPVRQAAREVRPDRPSEGRQAYRKGGLVVRRSAQPALSRGTPLAERDGGASSEGHTSLLPSGGSGGGRRREGDENRRRRRREGVKARRREGDEKAMRIAGGVGDGIEAQRQEQTTQLPIPP